MKNILRLNGIKYTKTDNKGSLSPLTVHGSSHEVLKDLGGGGNYFKLLYQCLELHHAGDFARGNISQRTASPGV